jgi:hypothetical protein
MCESLSFLRVIANLSLVDEGADSEEVIDQHNYLISKARLITKPYLRRQSRGQVVPINLPL